MIKNRFYGHIKKKHFPKKKQSLTEISEVETTYFNSKLSEMALSNVQTVSECLA